MTAPSATVSDKDASEKLTRWAKDLKMAAFNVQVFGRSKMRKPDVGRHLTKIFLRYDIIVMQEVRDRSGSAVPKLQQMINSECRPGERYKVVLSPRLGRTCSKEQYAFFYRQDKVEVLDTLQYDDVGSGIGDVFQRDPFVVLFDTLSTKEGTMSKFAVVAIHTDPDDAKREIHNLKKVHDEVVRQWEIEDVIITGDFNAGGNYVRPKDFVEIDLFKDKDFHWLIDEDTTVKSTNAAYDRFVVTGQKLLPAIQPDSVGVFNFGEEFGLSQEEAEKISDHYPIELAIQVDPELELPQLHGKLIKKKKDDTDVWLVNEYGHAQRIPSETCLAKLFRSTRKDVVTLPHAQSNIKEAEPISETATFAKSADRSDKGIYFISNCQKRLVVNDESTRRRFQFNVNPDKVVIVDGAVFANIPTGRPIQYPDKELRRFRKRKNPADSS